MKRYVIVAWTVPDAEAAARQYRKHGYTIAAVVTPRTLDTRLRGVVADEAIMTGGTGGDSALVARVNRAMLPVRATVQESS